MAAIRFRNGKWQARVRRKGHPTQEKTFISKTDAEKWCRQLEVEIDRGHYTDTAEAQRILFTDILQRYKEEVSPRKRGHEQETIRLDSLARSSLGKHTMLTLTSKVLAAWRDTRLKEVSSGTVNRDFNVISAVINVAVREWGISIPQNPVAQLKRPASPRGRERRLEPDEERRLLEELTVTDRAADGTFTGAQNTWMKPLVQLALETAMRRGELLSLRWCNVDLRRRTAYLPSSKNGEARTVPLSTRAVAILEALPESLDGRVFPTSADAIKKAFSRACERAGIAGVVFHTLRHEATSRLAERLSNVLELSAVTGHKDLRMLQRYYHPRAEEIAKRLG